MALPEGQSIELLQSAARTGGDFKDFVGYFDTAITTLLLGQSSTTDQGPWRGTAEIQKDVRDEVIASDCRLLDATLNTTIARWLTAWNFPGAAPPRIVHDASPPEDLDKRASREETIGRTSGLRPTQAHVEDVYGGQWEPAPASPMQGPEPAPATGVQPRRGGRAGPMLAAGDGEDTIGQAVHALLAGDGWAPLMEPMVEPLKDAIDAAIARGESLEAFKARVPELMRRMDETATAPMQGPEPAPATGVQPRRGGRAGPMLAAGDGEDTIGQAVHALLAGDGWAPLMEPMVEPLKDAIDAAIARGESLEAFKARVPELMRRMDETATAETLHNTTFSGVISGQGGEQ